ncbi:MAG: DUF2341 domain-containing protein [Candidatus ainarchaeum sp.]|nr:DUF2341 domain-containing protein [Candidatus ainarchaeum sp.]
MKLKFSANKKTDSQNENRRVRRESERLFNFIRNRFGTVLLAGILGTAALYGCENNTPQPRLTFLDVGQTPQEDTNIYLEDSGTPDSTRPPRDVKVIPDIQQDPDTGPEAKDSDGKELSDAKAVEIEEDTSVLDLSDAIGELTDGVLDSEGDAPNLDSTEEIEDSKELVDVKAELDLEYSDDGTVWEIPVWDVSDSEDSTDSEEIADSESLEDTENGTDVPVFDVDMDCAIDTETSVDAGEIIESNWWNGNWVNCTEIDIVGEFPEGYAHKVVLHPGVIDYQLFNVDGSDVRFLEGNCLNPNLEMGELKHWIESWNHEGESVVWVRTSTPNVGTIAMYHGNPTSESTSNGKGTFPLFDNFEGETLDPQWVLGGVGSVKVENGYVTPASYGSGVSWYGPDLNYALNSELSSYGWKVLYYFAHVPDSSEDIGRLILRFKNSSGATDEMRAMDTLSVESGLKIKVPNQDIYVCDQGMCLSDGWHLFEGVRDGTTLTVWFDGNVLGSWDTDEVLSSGFEVKFEKYSNNAELDIRVNSVIVYNYMADLPEYMVIDTTGVQ